MSPTFKDMKNKLKNNCNVTDNYKKLSSRYEKSSVYFIADQIQLRRELFNQKISEKKLSKMQSRNSIRWNIWKKG